MSLSNHLKLYRYQLWEAGVPCFVCGKNIEDYLLCTIEHVVPRSLGGANQKRNLSISHNVCNEFRGSIRCRIIWELPNEKRNLFKEKTRQQSKSKKFQDGRKDPMDKVYMIKYWKIKMVQKYLDHSMKVKKHSEKSIQITET